MVRVLLLGGLIVAVSLVFGLTTSMSSGVSTESFLGLPGMCVAETAQACWLQLGVGKGVLVVGAGGLGVVCITLYGAGVLFATGQLAAGGIAIGQAGVGLSFFLGQVGGGPVALGQLGIGIIADGQASLGVRGADFLRQLSDEVNELLKLPFR